MANKRCLKKMVNKVCSDLATECLIAARYVKGVKPEDMEPIVGKIADLQSAALANASFAYDKTPSDFTTVAEYHKARRAYFHKAYASFREKFAAHVQEIVKAMNAALPAEVKDASKAATEKA